MKNLSLLFIAFLFLQFTTLAQEGWFWQNPSPQGHNLESVYFINELTGWAAGGYGTIIKTTDGGETWCDQHCEVVDDWSGLGFLHFIDDDVGWVAEKVVESSFVYSRIHKTTNGGDDWIFQASMYETRALQFVDYDTGYAIGSAYEILKTTNGGDSWESQFYSDTLDLYSCFFINNSLGWAIGSSIILKTTNGGTDWFFQDCPVKNQLNSVYFINDSTGWIGGGYYYDNGVILKTTDGGENWIVQVIGDWGSYESIYFINENIGFSINNVRNEYGQIAKTTDGGLNWEIKYSEHIAYLNCISFTNNGIACAVGDDGMILKTTDEGEEWVPQLKYFKNYLDVNLQSVYFVNNELG
ncbi:MAG: YCF48-related protein [Ignavibacteriaceae bacterium]|jgi:photosystem II stability/assembly factor-like uncharacterized protein|nr:YCF48-related protein [Chlorobium sp.]MCW8816728.1 YCF48-related protein [Ignavibacteriaceae bacterium]MCW9095211.1 YCF48-related protein [Ignavibacteriaceae bacterium]MCW9097645.1 YCF48-related protein [Ignavibacteriaceae bacterium]